MKNVNDSENASLSESEDDGGSAKTFGKGGKRAVSIITAIVVLAVIAFNVAISAIGNANMWYFDTTRSRYKNGSSGFYTLSDKCKELIGSDAVPKIEQANLERKAKGEDPIKLKIVFCADRDIIEQDSMMRYISYTARRLANEYPQAIEVEYIDIADNPSAVQKYKSTSAVTIYSSNVIVEFGSEYLIQNASSFYYQDSTADSPWAYNGEQRLSAMIMSVTRAESLICAITSNHGETLFDENGNIKDEYSAFASLIGGAGYEIKIIDLEHDEIPENCRMMITFDPQSDFKAFGDLGDGGISEIEKLDRYLDGSNAFFYICNRETPQLKNLEEYLEEWGVAVSRATSMSGAESNYAVKDITNCTDSDGEVIIGSYATEGLGARLTEDLRKSTYPPKVIFGHAAAIKPSPSYLKVNVKADTESGTAAYSYYNYYKNGVNRNMLDIFSTHETAYAEIDGKTYEVATEQSTFKLMTVTQEERLLQESNYNSINKASYVISMSSTDFLSNSVLESAAYGNADVLLSTLRHSGSEAVPTNVELKAFYVYNMADDAAYTSAHPSVWFVCLVAVPALAALAVGVTVCVRRKYR